MAILGLVDSATGASYPYTYDIAGSVTGLPGEGEVLLTFVAPRAFTIPTDFSTSVGWAGTAATGSSAVLSLRKNGTQFGTLTFATGTQTGAFSSTAETFAVGDRLTVVAPATQNATLADFGFTVVCGL